MTCTCRGIASVQYDLWSLIKRTDCTIHARPVNPYSDLNIVIIGVTKPRAHVFVQFLINSLMHYTHVYIHVDWSIA